MAAFIHSSETTSVKGMGDCDINPEVEALLSEVSSALEERAGKDVFAIGGKADILNHFSKSTHGGSPLIIRWDSGESSHGRNLALPVGDNSSSKAAFVQLLTDCEPATFGISNREVLDETYRKAMKMDDTKFCTNFHPYEYGILDTIVQALAHSVHTSDVRNIGIRAELYKLNIYSSPSGKFRPHVDTPRSTEQMGSLVVCLPHVHQGGQLNVRHSGREIVFNWADVETPLIQWAAFFSDCEHEVLEVTQGHRLTLAYNLFWTTYGPALMANRLHVLEQESFHFFTTLKALLDCPQFLPQGGVLGFTCTHAYPHTSNSSIGNLHHSLKGLDMVVYQALQHLTGAAQVTAVVDDEEYRTFVRDRRFDVDDASDGTQCKDDETLHNAHAYVAKSPTPAILWRDFDYYDGMLDPASVGVHQYDIFSGKGAPMYPYQKITWLNHSPHSQTARELAVAFITYGNEPGIDAYYSSAVIVAEIGSKAPSAA